MTKELAVSKRAQRLLDELDEATREHAYIGMQMPEQHEDIEDFYADAKARVVSYIVRLEGAQREARRSDKERLAAMMDPPPRQAPDPYVTRLENALVGMIAALAPTVTTGDTTENNVARVRGMTRVGVPLMEAQAIEELYRDILRRAEGAMFQNARKPEPRK